MGWSLRVAAGGGGVDGPAFTGADGVVVGRAAGGLAAPAPEGLEGAAVLTTGPGALVLGALAALPVWRELVEPAGPEGTAA